MKPLRYAVATLVIVIVAVWICGWGKNDGHLFGDVLLARDMVYAGHEFADHGFATYGLPVYNAGGRPYTHLTPGPEWIQAIFAALQKAVDGSAPLYRWHWLATAALSLFSLMWLRRDMIRMLTATGVEPAQAPERASAGVLFIATTPAFIIFATHPYCAGTLLANVIAFAAGTWWATKPEMNRWRAALVRMTFALFIAFWLGLMPVASAGVWLLTAAARFGDAERRRRRIVQLSVAAALAVVVSIGLKYLQSVAVLRSFPAATSDFVRILAIRAGIGLEHSASEQVRTALFRLAYMFGFALFLIPLLLVRNRAARAEWPLMAGFLAGGFTWQIVMRGHSELHAYLMREAMVPVALLLALAAGTSRGVRTVLLAAVAEALSVFVILVAPLVVTGQPLWQLILRRL